MDDERRHPLQDRERLRQILRDWAMRDKVRVWRRDNPDEMEMPKVKSKIREKIKKLFLELCADIKLLF